MSKAYHAGTWFVALLQLCACTGAPEPAQASDMTFSNLRIEGLAPTRAVVRFDTSLPSSCEAHFGPSPGEPELTAVDPSMTEGQLAVEHVVPLEDLLPATHYSWRAKATDGEGRTFWSATNTFETLAPAGEAALTNVALSSAGTSVSGKSSNWGNAEDDEPFGALNAIDGKMASEWSTDGDGDDAWLELDLGQVHELTALGFRSRMMSDGTSIATSIEVVVDGTARVGPFATPDPSRLYQFDFGETIPASRVRFEVRSSTGGNTGAREVQLLVAQTP